MMIRLLEFQVEMAYLMYLFLPKYYVTQHETRQTVNDSPCQMLVNEISWEQIISKVEFILVY